METSFALLVCLSLSVFVCGQNTYSRTYYYGPIILKPGPNEGTEYGISHPAGSYGITSMSFNFLDSRGMHWNPYTVYLHHFILSNANQTNPLCPGPEPIFGIGSDLSPVIFPSNYTMVFNQSDWIISYMILNNQDEVAVAYFSYTINYITDFTGFIPISMLWLDETGCGDRDYNITKGVGFDERMTTYSFGPGAGILGEIVYQIGHMHPAGVNVSFWNPKTPDKMCVSMPTYGYDGEFIQSMSYCNWTVPLMGGEVYYLSSVYKRNPDYDLVGAMGNMHVYVHFFT